MTMRRLCALVAIAAAVVTSSCASVVVAVQKTASPPVACGRRPIVRSSCDRELADMTDCMICATAAACVDKRDSLYCVDATGCDDLRCAPTTSQRRDDHLLVH